MDFQSLTATAIQAPQFVFELLTPAPVSPWFKEGGFLEGYNEDLVQVFGSVLVFALLDWLFVKHLIVPKARYFALHVLCNAWVCCVSLPGVLRTFTDDPLTAFQGPSDTVASNNIIAALHLYHCIGFSLSADDIFHHLTFCFTLCSMAIPAKQVSGSSVPFAGFFLSGLPGGIDYLMLTLSAHGIVSKDTQKNLYTKLNVYMRGPAMTVYVFMVWSTSFHAYHPVPWYVATLSCFLHFYNGQYYTQQAIESNAIYRYRKNLEAQGLTVPEIRLVDLKNEGKNKSKKGKVVETKKSSTDDDDGDSSVMSPSSGSHVPLPRAETVLPSRQKARKEA